jgi:hypothetical protein
MKLTKYQLKVLRTWLRYYHSGYSFDQWFRGYRKMLFILMVLLAISIFLIWAGAPAFGWGYLGLFLGTVLRDITYFRLGRRTWPLSLDVIDWKRVQQLVDTHDQSS